MLYDFRLRYIKIEITVILVRPSENAEEKKKINCLSPGGRRTRRKRKEEKLEKNFLKKNVGMGGGQTVKIISRKSLKNDGRHGI